MNVIEVFQNMGARSIWKVFLLGIKHPFFVLPTLSATKKCLKLSTKIYGKAHHQNGPANAFRHALWNYLIAKTCFYWIPNPEKVQAWAEKITDWHEEAFINSPLARAMDLHNNAVGRYFFSKYISEPWEEVLDRLVDLAKDSILVLSEKDIDQNQMRLVHIIETK